MLDTLIPALGWPGGSAENTAIIAGVIVGAYVGALWLAALIWTIRDIRDRSDDPVTQVVAVLIVLIFNLPGWVLYQVVRPPMTLADVYERQLEEEALRRELDEGLVCPSCEREVEDDYVACPHCATTLKSPCLSCERAVSFSWVVCPWCGTRREGPQPAAPAAEAEQEPSPELVTAPAPAREIRPAPRPAVEAEDAEGPSSPFRRGRLGDRSEPRRVAAGD